MNASKRAAFRRWVTLGMCTTCALAVGFLWGRNSDSFSHRTDLTSTAARHDRTPSRVTLGNSSAHSGSSPGKVSPVGKHAGMADRIHAQDMADIHQALARISSIEDQIELIQELFSRWHDSPLRALEFVQGLPSSPFRADATAEALVMVAVDDPAFALAETDRLLKGNDRHNALISVVEKWSARAPEQALQWAINQENPQLRSNALESLAAVWGSNDPAAAIRHLNSLSPEERTLALRAVAGTWAQTQSQAALDWALGYFSTQGDAEPLTVGLANTAHHDPATAAEFLRRVGNPELENQLVPAIVRSWIMRDPNQGWSYALGVENPGLATRALQDAVETWVSFDAASAAAAIRQLPAGSEQQRTAMDAFSLATASHLNGELDIRELIPDPDAVPGSGD